MSADATTLLTTLLSATPAKISRASSSNVALQQALLKQMGMSLQLAQKQLQQGKGLNMKVDVDVMRAFVRNAALLTNHLINIQQSNIECKQVHELFAEQKDVNKMCNILVTGDKKQKCKVVSDKCLPVAEAAAHQREKVRLLLVALAKVTSTEAKAYAQLVDAVLNDLKAKTTDQCKSDCAQMVQRFARATTNAFELFKQQNIEPYDQTVQIIQTKLTSNDVSNLDETIKSLKQALQNYKATAQQALKTLHDQQKVFQTEYAKLARS